MYTTAVALFLLLSPGLLLTLPPVGGKVFMSGKTSVMAILAHTAVFAFLLYNARQIPLLNQLEPYEDYTKGEVAGVAIGSIIGGIIVGVLFSLAFLQKTQ